MTAIDHPIHKNGIEIMCDLWKHVSPAWKITVYQYREGNNTRVGIDVETFETFENVAQMRPFQLAVSMAVAFVDGFESERHEHA